MTQLDLISRNFIRDGLKAVNVVGTRIGQCPDDAKFGELYNDEIQYLGNQMGDSDPNYQQ